MDSTHSFVVHIADLLVDFSKSVSLPSDSVLDACMWTAVGTGEGGWFLTI